MAMAGSSVHRGGRRAREQEFQEGGKVGDKSTCHGGSAFVGDPKGSTFHANFEGSEQIFNFRHITIPRKRPKCIDRSAGEQQDQGRRTVKAKYLFGRF